MMRAAWEKLRQRRLAVLALAMGNLILALLATAPLSPPLARALDDRPAAAAVADSPDDGARAELLEDHPELTATALECGALALLLWAAFSAVAAGGLLGDEPFLAGCARHARRMIAVGLMGTPLRLLALLGPLLGWAIIDGAHRFSTVVTGALGALVVGGLLWSMATVIIDRARGLDLPPWKALKSALSPRRLGSTFFLALISALGFVLVTSLQLACTHWLPPTALGGVVAFTAAAFGALGRAALSAFVLFAANS
jgi:hypothetical protein